MRVVVMSDIHGFNLALETVIADLDAETGREPVSAVIVAGDLCEGGPGPAETLALLHARGYTLLRGNTDQGTERLLPSRVPGFNALMAQPTLTSRT